MSKSAIINLGREGYVERVNFKQLALFFDQIYTQETTRVYAMIDIEKSQSLDSAQKKILQAEIDWLSGQGILSYYRLPMNDVDVRKLDPALSADILRINEEIQAQLIPVKSTKGSTTKSGKLQLAGILGAPGHFYVKMEDMRIRIDAVQLGIKNPQTQFIPLVHSFDSYHSTSAKEAACHFILDKIPIPDMSTSWEQLLEFRSDAEIKRKYYALIHWINGVSRQDMPISHLADQYNQLYSEYQRQFSLHRLSTNLTTVESLVLGGIELISSIAQHNFVTAFRGLLNFRKKQVTLLQAEKNIEGRELAYIFAVEEKFKKP